MKTSYVTQMSFVSLRFQTDIKKCQIKNWKGMSKNRVYWEKSVKEAKVRSAIQEHEEEEVFVPNLHLQKNPMFDSVSFRKFHD